MLQRNQNDTWWPQNSCFQVSFLNYAATFHTFKLIMRALGQTVPKQPPWNGSYLLTSRRGRPQWIFISVSKVPMVSCFICFVWVFTKKYNNYINYLCSALSDLPNHDENDHKINQDSHDWRCRSGHECWPLQICMSELKSYVYRSELKCAMKKIGKDFIEKLHTGTSRKYSGWESDCQCGGHGFDHLSGKIPCAMG